MRSVASLSRRTLTRRQIEAVLDAAGALIVADELERLVQDHGVEYRFLGVKAVSSWVLRDRAAALRRLAGDVKSEEDKT